MYNFSLIIPHKDSPELLQRCLDSVPVREDLQVIIVDDNSDDRIVDFEHFPGRSRLNSICIFDKSGKGAGHARNLALSVASGKWLIFADADDYFAPAFSEILEKYKEDSETEIVFFNYCKIKEDGAQISMPISRYIVNYQKRRFMAEKVLRYSAWAPWSRMIKRELQLKSELYFEELPFSNDMMFVLKVTSEAVKLSVVPDCVYYYYAPSSGSHTAAKFYNPEFKQLRLEVALKLWNFYRMVKYPFISPIWRTERNLGIKVDNNMRTKYGFSKIYNITDTLLYLFAKICKII